MPEPGLSQYLCLPQVTDLRTALYLIHSWTQSTGMSHEVCRRPLCIHWLSGVLALLTLVALLWSEYWLLSDTRHQPSIGHVSRRWPWTLWLLNVRLHLTTWTGSKSQNPLLLESWLKSLFLFQHCVGERTDPPEKCWWLSNISKSRFWGLHLPFFTQPTLFWESIKIVVQGRIYLE